MNQTNRDFFNTASVLAVVLLLWLTACRKEEQITSGTFTPVELQVPEGFPPQVIPRDNLPSVERIALGRRLYYDPILSGTGLSCSSCHLQEQGFTSASTGMPVLPHANMGWKTVFMWDGRETGTLEDVMQFEVEEFFATDLSVLAQHPDYPRLFREAYNVQTIDSRDVARALAQFARFLVTADSKYDRVRTGRSAFTADEAAGFAIFSGEKGGCFHCHALPLLADNTLHNIGLENDFQNPVHQGYFTVSGDSADLGRMRTANLRNVALRNRFMHDGRFTSLEEVVEHYNSRVKTSPSLDPVLTRNGNTQLGLTETEKAQLVAFLRTLTDSTFISDIRFGQP